MIKGRLAGVKVPNFSSKFRLDGLDVARGAALLAMASYHFCWNLELFGYLEAGTAGTGFLRIYARIIAASFLFIVGFSLVLATLNGIKWRPYGLRLVQVSMVAALISAVTFITIPNSWIFFGILHHIVFASLIGLLFLKLHWAAVLLAGIIALALPGLELFTTSSPWLVFIGLFEISPSSNDFVPIFPWLSASLFGIAVAKLAQSTNLMSLLAGPKADFFPARQLKFLGQNSLLFYVTHQPVLIFLVWLFSQIVPPSANNTEAAFKMQCKAVCEVEFNAQQCETYCVCFENELKDDAARWSQLTANDKSKQISEICSQIMQVSPPQGILN